MDEDRRLQSNESGQLLLAGALAPAQAFPSVDVDAVEAALLNTVNPNLVLSTDDTTLFVFEGTSKDGKSDDWDWKLVDMTEAPLSTATFKLEMMQKWQVDCVFD